MAAAAKSDDRHAGGDRGGNPDNAVLDHDACGRQGAEPARRQQKQIGCRFADRDLHRAEDMRLEKPQQPGQRQPLAHPLQMAVRGDAARARSTPSAIRRPRRSASVRVRGRVRCARASLRKSPPATPAHSGLPPRRSGCRGSCQSRATRASSAVAGKSASVRHSPSTRAKIVSLSTRTPSQSKMTRSATCRPSQHRLAPAALSIPGRGSAGKKGRVSQPTRSTGDGTARCRQAQNRMPVSSRTRVCELPFRLGPKPQPRE